MKSDILVCFSLYGDEVDLSQLTREISVQPTEIRKKGERGKYNTDYKLDSWNLSSGYVKTQSVDEVFRFIYDKLKDKEHVINDLIKRMNITAKFFIVIKACRDSTLGFVLENDIIQFANNIKAIFDIDMYT